MFLSCALAAALMSSPAPVETVGQTFKPTSVRSERPITLGLETGWNGLAGVGLTASYNFHWRFSLDGGAGFSTVGPKVGLRARYNFLPGNLTPFVGLGAMYGFGSETSFTEPKTSTRAQLKLPSGPFGQAVAGLSWVTDGGFSLLASAGYAHRFGEQATASIDGGSKEAREMVTNVTNALANHGPVVSLALGYAF